MTDAQVTMSVTPTVTVGWPQDIPATNNHDGTYTVQIPTNDPTFGSGIPKKCNAGAELIGAVCEVFEPINNSSPILMPLFCSELSAVAAALAASGVGLPAAGTILAGCTLLVTVAEKICSTVNYGPTGAPSVGQGVCNFLEGVIDQYNNQNVTLRPTAEVGGQFLAGESQNVSGNGGFPNFTIDFAGDTTIAGFSAEPASPSVGQGYVATAQITCAPTNTQVIITVNGTDGYSNATSCVVQGSQSCSLSVPARSAASSDTLVARAGTATKTIALTLAGAAPSTCDLSGNWTGAETADFTDTWKLSQDSAGNVTGTMTKTAFFSTDTVTYDVLNGFLDSKTLGIEWQINDLNFGVETYIGTVSANCSVMQGKIGTVPPFDAWNGARD